MFKCLASEWVEVVWALNDVEEMRKCQGFQVLSQVESYQQKSSKDIAALLA
jgi:hypothetical protein